jgi:hypothetical protein
LTTVAEEELTMTKEELGKGMFLFALVLVNESLIDIE